jgi:hypothetical protein
MDKKKKVYVAGPLNAVAVDYIKNCHKMCTIAEAIRRRGFSVYIPCLDFLMGLLTGTYTYADYFDNSQPWLTASDALFFCSGWRESKGCMREYVLAGESNIPTFEIISDLVRHFEDE